jgi:hypothetical protein
LTGSTSAVFAGNEHGELLQRAPRCMSRENRARLLMDTGRRQLWVYYISTIMLHVVFRNIQASIYLNGKHTGSGHPSDRYRSTWWKNILTLANFHIGPQGSNITAQYTFGLPALDAKNKQPPTPMASRSLPNLLTILAYRVSAGCFNLSSLKAMLDSNTSSS